MAVWFTRTGEVAQGKVEEGLRWALKVAEHVNKTSREIHVEVLNNISGRLDQIHWIMRSESLASFEEVISKIDADDKYQAFVREANDQGLFTKIVDELYRVIA